MNAASLPSLVPRPRQRPEAVIFDMDGLMLDTEPMAARAWTDAAALLGIDFDPAVTPHLVGRNFPDCVAMIRAHHGDGYPVEALTSGWHGAYDALVHREGIVLKPGLMALITWLDEQGIPKAVATSTRRERAKSKLAQTHLLEHFSTLVGGDEIERGKPAPDIYLEAAGRLGIAAATCVALEDSEPGFNAALAAGMMPIMVPDLGHPSPALLAREPLILPSLSDVHAYLAALPAPARVR